MANFEKNICEAIEVIANNLISNAGFDRTIQATIVSCVNNATGKYKIKYQDNLMHAYSGEPEKTYSKGSQVYVLIPGGDFTKDKKILGIAGEINTEYDPNTIFKDRYEFTSSNLIENQDSEFKIWHKTNEKLENLETGNSYKLEIIKDYSVSKTQNNFIKRANVFIKRSKYLYLSGIFSTNIEDWVDNIINNYTPKFGLELVLLDKKNNEVTYNLDNSNGIYGTLSLLNNVESHIVIRLPDNIKAAKSIKLFVSGFMGDGEEHINYINPGTEIDYDIFVKNLKMYTAVSVQDEIGKDGIILTYPTGHTILTSDPKETIKVIPQIILNNKISTTEHKFYWFVRDYSQITIPENAEEVVRNVGLGWQYIATTSEEYNFVAEKHLLSSENHFLVAAIAEDNVIYKREFDLFNINYDIEIVIKSDHEQGFNLNNRVSNLTLTCNVIDNETNTDLTDQYTYYWKINYLSQDIYDINIMRQSFGDLSIVNNIMQNINFTLLDDTIERVQFACTAKKDSFPIGSATATVTLKELFDIYTLFLINGDKTFLYDANGILKTNNFDNKLKIQIIENSTGNVIEGEELRQAIWNGDLIIHWEYTNESHPLITSLLPNSGIVNGNKLEYDEAIYDINNNFSYENLYENNIIVNAIYKNVKLNRTTNFSFIKDGMLGTNGTEYGLQIVPDINNLEDNKRWVVFYNIINGAGYFDFNSGINYKDSRGKKFPFKAVFTKNGDVIQDNENINIDWSIVSFVYENDELNNSIRLESNFKINKSNLNSGPMLSFVESNNFYKNSNNEYKYEYEDSNIKPYYNVSNVIRCKLEYKERVEEHSQPLVTTLYAFLPIVVVTSTSSNITLDFDQDSGFKEVTYDNDGFNPKYDKVKNNFKVIYTGDSNLKVYTTGVSEIKNNKFLLSKNLIIDKIGTITPAEANEGVMVNPAVRFDSYVSSDAIVFESGDNYIHIPICLYCNRYNMKLLNDWDGQKVEIDEDDGYILAPIVGAGRKTLLKDGHNSFTGILMGDLVRQSTNYKHIGLYGLYNGIESFSLQADTGIVNIGLDTSARITIDPTNNNSFIFGGGFFNNNVFDFSTRNLKTEIYNRLYDIERTGKIVNFSNKARYGDPYPKIDIDENIIDGEIVLPEEPEDRYRAEDGNYYYKNSSYISNQSGMLLDLKNGVLAWGNGNLFINPEGNIVSKGGRFENGKKEGKLKSYIDLSINNKSLFEKDNFLLRSGDKFFINKQGLVFGTNIHLQNASHSLWLDFSDNDDDTYGILFKQDSDISDNSDNVRIEPFLLNEREVYSENSTRYNGITFDDYEELSYGDKVFYPSHLNDFCFCSLDIQGNNLVNKEGNNFIPTTIRTKNINTAITKDGKFITRLGKIGGFYIGGNSFSSQYIIEQHGANDLSFSSTPFNITMELGGIGREKTVENKNGEKVIVEKTSWQSSSKNVEVVFAVGKSFAIQKEADKVILTSNIGRIGNIESQTIDTMGLTCYGPANFKKEVLFEKEVNFNDKVIFGANGDKYSGFYGINYDNDGESAPAIQVVGPLIDKTPDILLTQNYWSYYRPIVAIPDGEAISDDTKRSLSEGTIIIYYENTSTTTTTTNQEI